MSGVTALRALSRRRARAQKGVASLIVVMVLFFVVSMVAAYTNRSLLFEQRTSANQQRSTRALEAAEAGVEWALSMLNSGRTTGNCQISANAADTTFRQRYLEIEPESGNVTPKKRTLPDGTLTSLYAACSNVGGVWNCSCPSDSAPALVAAPGADSFRVRFRRVCADTTASEPVPAPPPPNSCTVPVQPGVIHIDVNGCTTLDDDCLRFNDEAVAGKPIPSEGRATVHVMAALVGALPVPTGAALTTRSGLSLGPAANLKVVNSDTSPEAAPNVTVHTGDPNPQPGPPPLELFGASGTPGAQTARWGDGTLSALTPDALFVSTFGMNRTTYANQPGVVVVDCSGTCNATTVRDRAVMNPGRMLWLNGDVNLDSVVTIGTSDEPVVLNATGSLTFGSAATVNGLVYSQAATWTMNGAGQIVGAAVAENALAGAPTGSVTYSIPILKRLRTTTGSFVKVPGSWKDFQ